MSTTFEAGFDKAFGEASAEHSEEQAAVVPAKEAEAAQTDETPPKEKGTESAPAQVDSEGLLPTEEYERLRKDPEALRTALNKAFTQKTQALAEREKQLEPHVELLRGLREDPQGTVRQLAEQLGIKLESTETKAEAQTVTNELVADLKASLGPDLEFLADKLAPAIERSVLKLTGQAVAEKIKPLEQQTKEIRDEAIKQQVEANYAAFTEKHPDWKKYESQMTAKGLHLQPASDPKTGKYPTWMEYMEDLYYLASKDARDGDVARKTVERMKEAAEKSDTSGGGVQDSRVAKSAPKFTSLDEAFDRSFQDAAAGIVYE